MTGLLPASSENLQGPALLCRARALLGAALPRAVLCMQVEVLFKMTRQEFQEIKRKHKPVRKRLKLESFERLSTAGRKVWLQLLPATPKVATSGASTASASTSSSLTWKELKLATKQRELVRRGVTLISISGCPALDGLHLVESVNPEGRIAIVVRDSPQLQALHTQTVLPEACADFSWRNGSARCGLELKLICHCAREASPLLQQQKMAWLAAQSQQASALALASQLAVSFGPAQPDPAAQAGALGLPEPGTGEAADDDDWLPVCPSACTAAGWPSLQLRQCHLVLQDLPDINSNTLAFAAHVMNDPPEPSWVLAPTSKRGRIDSFDSQASIESQVIDIQPL